MTRRYKITLVDDEESNGSRRIVTKSDNGQEVDFSVERKYLCDYTPNPGDLLIRDSDDGSITFDHQESPTGLE